MGWLAYDRPKGQTDLEHFRQEFCRDNPARLIDGATVRNVFYGAYVMDNGHVGALVVLLQRGRRGDGFNFAYKDMCETMGPYETRCPARILDMLTDAEKAYGPQNPDPSAYCSTRNAKEWRAACRDER